VGRGFSLLVDAWRQKWPNGAAVLNSLKTVNSRRKIPLHPKLIQLGFICYCDALRKAAHDCLFLLFMLTAVAEVGRVLLIECTQVGLSRAKAEGKKLKIPFKIVPEARKAIKNNGLLAHEYVVSRSSITIILNY
jgi:hypothetical protein